MAITSPALQDPFAVVDVTDDTIGAPVSITKALFAPNEPEAPGLASVKVALFPAPSRIVPLFNAKELVALQS